LPFSQEQWELSLAFQSWLCGLISCYVGGKWTLFDAMATIDLALFMALHAPMQLLDNFEGSVRARACTSCPHRAKTVLSPAVYPERV